MVLCVNIVLKLCCGQSEPKLARALVQIAKKLNIAFSEKLVVNYHDLLGKCS